MPRSRKNRWLGVSLGLAVSVALLAYLINGLDWGAFFQELHRVDFRYLPLLLVLYVLPFGMRAVRNQLLLPNGANCSLRSLVDALVLGTLASCVLPLRAGEIVRPWFIERWGGARFSTAFASVVTERVFDVIAMMLLLILALSQAPDVPPFVALGAKSLAMLTVVIIGMMTLAYVRPEIFSAAAGGILDRLFGRRSPILVRKLHRVLDEFSEGLRGISNSRELMLVVIWSLAIWLEYSLTYQVGLWMFGDFPSFFVGVTACVLVALAVAAPSAPGFVGTFQVGCVAALTGLYGYSQEFSLAYSLVLHALNLIAVFLSSVLVVSLRGVSLREIGRERSSPHSSAG